MRNLLKIANQHKLRYLVGFFALIITDLGQIAIPKYLIPPAFDMAIGKQKGPLIYYIIAMLLIAVIIALGRFTWRNLILGASRQIETTLRQRLFSSMLKLSSTFFKEYNSGDLMARSTNDLKNIRTATGMAFVAMVDSLIMLVVSLTAILTSYGMLALIVISPLALIPPTLIGIGIYAMKKYKEVQESYSKLTAFVQESLVGIHVIKTLTKESFNLKKFKELNEDYKKRNKTLIKTFGMLFPIIGAFVGISNFFLIRFGGSKVLTQDLSPGQFTALYHFLIMLVWPMIAIGYSLNMMTRGMVSMKRINEILDRKSDIPYPEEDDQLLLIENNLLQQNAKKEKGNIQFKQLNYAYPDESKQMVLKDINFSIKHGEKIGIIGKTGSGKSTLINLIPRLLNPKPNSIFINEKDITQFNIHKLRSLITFVPQETLLFSDSIRNNIAFGEIDPRSCNDEEIKIATRVSTINKEFQAFSDGWETIIGEKGTTISGGQKQRIAIARALMKKAPIMILDDALSSVDNAAEEKILSELKKYYEDKTVIIISHRISALNNCDRIIVLDKGRIVESGTFEELIKQDGIFREIAIIQNGGKIPKLKKNEKGKKDV